MMVGKLGGGEGGREREQAEGTGVWLEAVLIVAARYRPSSLMGDGSSPPLQIHHQSGKTGECA